MCLKISNYTATLSDSVFDSDRTANEVPDSFTWTRIPSYMSVFHMRLLTPRRRLGPNHLILNIRSRSAIVSVVSTV